MAIIRGENKMFDSTDVIAAILVLGSFGLLVYHIDTIVPAILTAVIGFYFGSKHQQL